MKDSHQITIAVTRPQSLAVRLARKLQKLGAKTIIFPTIAIAPSIVDDIADITAKLNLAAMLIFISRHAVAHGVAFIAKHHIQLAKGVKIAAIGQQTAMQLKSRKWQVDYCPKAPFSSESLLSLPVFHQLNQHRVVIIRGQGGREYLGATLIARGAKVDYLEVYQRCCPLMTTAKLLITPPDVIISTSGESLYNLYYMTSPCDYYRLLNCQLVVISHRMLSLAKQLGFVKLPIMAASARDDDVINSLKNHDIVAS